MFNSPRLRTQMYPCYKLYMKVLGVPLHLTYDREGQSASDLIKEFLQTPKPCMISRFGSLELQVIMAYLNQQEKSNPFSRLICKMRWELTSYTPNIRMKISNNAGFFPATPDQLDKFSERMLADSSFIDILGSWRSEETKLQKYFPDSKIIPLDDLEPFKFDNPWTKALEGKKILVIHPFETTIKQQYQKRELLFKNKDMLPVFELKTLKAIQSAAQNPVDFETWFDALRFMCDEIDKINYDIAIIGAGAYGLPLAAHIKRNGKKAVHMGGASQLLFGIKGNRWDNGVFYSKLYNSNWTRASKEETPEKSSVIEGATYW